MKTRGTRRRNGRILWLAGLAVALLCAGVLSGYASTSPDGLESVADRLGFAETAAAGSPEAGPLADYQMPGVEDPLLSTGLAGVVGTIMVLATSSGLFWLARRRRATESG